MRLRSVSEATEEGNPITIPSSRGERRTELGVGKKIKFSGGERSRELGVYVETRFIASFIFCTNYNCVISINGRCLRRLRFDGAQALEFSPDGGIN
jgi:hypothetical protein